MYSTVHCVWQWFVLPIGLPFALPGPRVTLPCVCWEFRPECRWVCLQLGYVCTLIAPEGMAFFAAPHPVPCGANLQPGVAILATPSTSHDKDGVQPSYFVFNAGNIAGKKRVCAFPADILLALLWLL